MDTINLDDIVKLVQISFYMVMAVVAMMTYRSAKRGLLNTVHTEYQKKVIERLDQLSKEIGSEFISSSDNHWSKKEPIKEMVDKVNQVFSINREYIEELGEYPFGRIATSTELRMMNLVEELEVDSFLPESIRQEMIAFYNNRLQVMSRVFGEAIEQYASDLLAGKPHLRPGELDENYDEFHNNIIEKLNQNGCGVSDVKIAANTIRAKVQSYLESYNPL